MNKKLAGAFAAIGAAAVVTAGCGQIDRAIATTTGYSTICVKETGVKYVQFTSGAAPLVDQAGKPVPCNP